MFNLLKYKSINSEKDLTKSHIEEYNHCVLQKNYTTPKYGAKGATEREQNSPHVHFVREDKARKPAADHIILNKLNYYDTDFFPKNGGYTSYDPRLLNGARNGESDRLILDTIPLNGKLHAPTHTHAHATSTLFRNTITPNKFANINQGQIRYYYSSDLATPFIPQLFGDTPSVSASRNNAYTAEHVYYTKQDYFDPMGVYKPYFIKINNECIIPNTSIGVWDLPEHEDDGREGPTFGPRVTSENFTRYNPSKINLSWIRDSQYQRNELISKQLISQNRNKFSIN